MPGFLSPALSFGVRIGILAGLALALTFVAWMAPVTPQDPAYHLFADGRPWLGVPNFGDVASNGAFLVVSVMGFGFLFGPAGRTLFREPGERLPYGVFFAALALVTAGSAYYHWAPAMGPLFWDRLPITIAFMALLAAFIADRIHLRTGVPVMMPLLIALGAGLALHWRLSEAAGAGDLRFYVLVQVYPLIAIPLICRMFPGRITTGRHVLFMVLWYGAGKGLEFADGQVFALLGGVVSGHTLKHLASAAAAYMVLAMLKAKARDIV